ncbi:MAG TPA: mannose-6-phosphate isomerase [Trebonia sp.]|jgi:mannose-6-phosphate isomerase|nr:mannose-6-phosphate isomerase [Trebonia sp.]
MSLAPLLLGPNQPPRFYRGGRGIARLRGAAATGEFTPEDLVASTTELAGGGGLTVLGDGRTLREAIAADPRGYLGPRHADRFGADLALLVKLLDTGERLLVHFHPGRAFAREHLHSCHGKTEAWIITDVAPDPADPTGGHVYLGFRADASREAVRGWVEAQDKAALLGALNQVPVRPGDTCLVPAGVPHAIGAGITLAEVQEPTDFSILLEWAGFAIDGPAEGHLGLGFGLALEALDRSAWGGQRLAGLFGTSAAGPGDQGVTRLLPAAADPFFRAERIEAAARPGGVRLDPQVAVLVVLDGHGQLRAGEGSLPLARGTTVFVPYGAGQTSIDGPVTLLRCLPPDPGSTP